MNLQNRIESLLYRKYLKIKEYETRIYKIELKGPHTDLPRDHHSCGIYKIELKD